MRRGRHARDRPAQPPGARSLLWPVNSHRREFPSVARSPVRGQLQESSGSLHASLIDQVANEVL